MLNKELIKKLKHFFIIYLLFLLVGLYFVLLYEKEYLTVILNSNNSSNFDVFFTYLTRLGEWISIVSIIIISLFISKRMLITSILGILLQAGLSSLFKFYIFNDFLRPKLYLKNKLILHEVIGETINLYNSFPSGHTTTAFTIFTLLAYFFSHKLKILSIVLLILALFVGISRMYLGQHFLEDVIAGSLLGIFCALFSIWIINLKIKNNTFDKPIIKLFNVSKKS